MGLDATRILKQRKLVVKIGIDERCSMRKEESSVL